MHRLVKEWMFPAACLIVFSCSEQETGLTRSTTDEAVRAAIEGPWRVQITSDCDSCPAAAVRIDLFRSGPGQMEAYVSDTSGFVAGHFMGSIADSTLRLVQVFSSSDDLDRAPDLSSRDTIEMQFADDSTYGQIRIPNEYFTLAELNLDSTLLQDSVADGVDKLLQGDIDPTDSFNRQQFEFGPSSQVFAFSGSRNPADTARPASSFLARRAWSLGSLCGTVADAVNTILTLPGLDLVTAWYRPMGGCTLHRDGGGFYLNGYRGSGLLTYSLYVPEEVAACTNRQYKFNIRLKEEWIVLSALGEIGKLSNSSGAIAMTSELLKHLSDATLRQVLDTTVISSAVVEKALNKAYTDLYAWCGGGFGISFAMNTRNHTVSVYVNVKDEAKAAHHRSAIVNHWFIKLLCRFGPKGHSVYVGTNIKDSFHLNRNPTPSLMIHSCTSPLFIVYVLGTHVVEFD